MARRHPLPKSASSANLVTLAPISEDSTSSLYTPILAEKLVANLALDINIS